MNRNALLIIILFVFLIFSQTTNAQSNKKSDAEIEGLRGKVMSVKDKYYKEGRIFFGLIPFKKEFSDEYKEFNKKGNLVFKDKPSYQGENYRDREFYKYNDKGDCIEISDTIYENVNKYSYLNRYEYIYDKKGNISEKKRYFNNKSSNDYFYKYDDKGNCIEMLSKVITDSSFSKHIYLRDTNGQMIVCQSYNMPDGINYKLVFALDNKGNIIKIESFFGDINKGNETLYIYNSERDVIVEVNYNNLDNYYYASTFKYKYDTKGNWIKKIEYNEKGKIIKISKRKIKYYDD